MFGSSKVYQVKAVKRETVKLTCGNLIEHVYND
ncbi:hypothetical protein Enr10x_04640 [Gimesia panareensis]|uniref:Uncharacterized protein n=1 Tax=Gimesia panareensis TaxID=2527978 RepID=A0A517Q0K7_9PLAN|nr:hypothetical protein Enr10x_04640 [Gimesia panareensis]